MLWITADRDHTFTYGSYSWKAEITGDHDPVLKGISKYEKEYQKRFLNDGWVIDLVLDENLLQN